MHSSRPGGLRVFSGSSHEELTQEICEHLWIQPGDREIFKFANDNTFVKIGVNVREADVFIVQPSAIPVNDSLVELLIMIDALKHASAARVTAIVPYYPYVRSDKKDQPRISIAARLIADLLESAGADRILTMDLHSPQIHGFFRIPVDHLLAGQILCEYFKQHDLSNTAVAAPDVGSAKRAEAYAKELGLPLVILDKRRKGNEDKAYVAHMIGDVKDKNIIIFDDEVSTGGSLIQTVEALKNSGANKVRACIVHPVLCGQAMERIQNSDLDEIVVTNSLPVGPEKRIDKLTVLSIAPLFAEAIRRIHNGESVSGLFKPI